MKPGKGRTLQVGLTVQEEAFCRAYVELFPEVNGTEAARRARYSAKTAKAAANILMKKPKIKARIAELMAPVWARAARKHQRTEITNQRLLEEAMAIASSDIRDGVTVENGRVHIQDSPQWPDEFGMAVASVSEGQFGVKITMHPKLEALKVLMTARKMLGAEAIPPGMMEEAHIYRYNLPEKQVLELAPAPVGGAPQLTLHLPQKEPNGYPSAPATPTGRHPVILDHAPDAPTSDDDSGDAELQ